MGIAKGSSGYDEANTTFVDFGFGDVALSLKVNLPGDFCELHMEDAKIGKVGRVVPDGVELASDNKVTLTFPLESPDSLDVLLTRLLEMRLQYYQGMPSTVFKD